MYIMVFILGLLIGSFLNSYIWRLHSGESVWRGRSYCPKCGKHLRWYELIPLISFALQIGRCRGCRKPIDWQYPAVELAAAVLFLLAFERTKLSFVQRPVQSLALIDLIVAGYLLSILLILFVYDLRYGLVPDRVVLPAIVVGGIWHVTKLSFVHSSVQSLALVGVAILIGAAFFAAQYYVSRGRWLGAGDIRLGALMGAILGWPQVVLGIVVSYMIGGAVGIILLLTGRKKFGQTVPLGTFLTLGTAIAFLYGEQIWNWYWEI